MKTFKIINSIPSGKCPQLSFSHTEYSYVCGDSFYTPGHLISLPSPIISFASTKYHFLLTKDELYQTNYAGEIISSMKITKRCLMVKTHCNYIILFYESCYEMYEIPVEYHPVMYKLVERCIVDTCIISVDLYNDFMVCGCTDNSVRIFHIGKGEIFLDSFIGKIYGCFITENRIIVVAGEDIFFYQIELRKDNDTYILFNKTIVSNIRLKQIKAVCYNRNEDLLLVGRKEENTVLEIYKGTELYLTPEVDVKNISNIYVNNNMLGVVSDDEIVIVDYINNITKAMIDTSEIFNFNVFNDFIIVGSAKSIRIFKDNKQISMHKIRMQSKVIFTHATKSILITISSLGTVRLFDIQNFHCFKIFDIEFVTLSSEINEDGSLLFLSNKSILFYDTKRGAVIDELKGHSGPITKIKYKSSFLYSLGMDNFIRKQYIYDTKRSSFELEHINSDFILDFDLKKFLYCLTNNEITIYDTDFNYVKSICLSLKGKMTYNKISVINDSLVAVCGQSKNYKNETITYLQIYSVEHLVLIQSIVVESATLLDSTFDAFLLITAYGIKMIGQYSVSFDPIDIEVNCTPENIENLIKENKLLALVASIKMNDHQLVLRVIKEINEAQIDSIIRHFPKKYVSYLRKHVNQIENNLLWIKSILFWHTNIGDAFKVSRKVTEGMKYARLNHYIINANKRRETKLYFTPPMFTSDYDPDLQSRPKQPKKRGSEISNVVVQQNRALAEEKGFKVRSFYQKDVYIETFNGHPIKVQIWTSDEKANPKKCKLSKEMSYECDVCGKAFEERRRLLIHCRSHKKKDDMGVSGKESDVKDSDLKDSNFKSSDIKDSEVKDSEVKETEVKETEVKETEVKDSEVKDSEVKETDLKESNYKESDVRDSDMKESDVKESDLKESQLKDSEVIDSEVKESDLKDVKETDNKESDVKIDSNLKDK